MSASISPGRLSSMIAAIYDAAVDPPLWPAAMAMICEELDFSAGMLGLQELPSGARVMSATFGLDRAWWEPFELMGSESVDWWGGADIFQQHSLNEPLVLSRTNPTAFLPDDADPFYNNFVRPLRLADTVAIVLGWQADWMGVIGFGRQDVAGPTPTSVIETLTLLVPHLQRAAAINQILNVQSLARATLEAVLDALKTPAIVVDENFSVLFANEAAQTVLAAGQAMSIRNGVLTVQRPGFRAALAAAVAQCIANESSLGRKGLGIPSRSADDLPQAIHVMPLRRGSVRRSLRPGAAAAIFLTSASTAPDVPDEVIAGLFGLTDAEARVFNCIAAGRTVAETARSLGVGIGTVRTHLARVFDKTGTHRQADLVLLRESFAIPFVA
jgi:DNA-binding CsgD family transcriptional regulator